MGAEAPFFSPDGRYLGFLGHGGDNIFRMLLADHSVRPLMPSQTTRGASWGADDRIVYADAGSGLFRIAVSGGEPERLLATKEGESDYRWPQVLPDGRHVLFTASVRGLGLQARLLDLESGAVYPLDVLGVFARYVTGGFLVYLRANVLWATRLDLDARRTVGDPVRVVDGVHVSDIGTNPHLAITDAGRLVYEPRRPPSPGRGLVWVDRAGEKTSIHDGMGYEFPRVSPDGRSILFANHKPDAKHDVCAFDLDRTLVTQLTTDGDYIEPVWSPDGRSIVFSEFTHLKMFTMELSRGSAPRPLAHRLGWQYPLEWRFQDRLLLEEIRDGFGSDIVEYDVATGSAKPLLATTDGEEAGTVSPDGRWLAYVSDKSARREVYVRRYPELGREQRVSIDGGVEPAWSRDGRELFYRSGRSYYVVDVPESLGNPIGTPRKLFEGLFVEGFRGRANYDVSADGKKFVMVEGGWGLTANRLDVHLQFRQELEAALPRK